MKVTGPQHAALSQIALEPEGSMPLHRIKGRMVNAYRVARSLEEKGLVTRMNAGRDSGDYLYITAKGREHLARRATDFPASEIRESQDSRLATSLRDFTTEQLEEEIQWRRYHATNFEKE